ncbi:MAG TPA: HEAT repeat domain-containing protein [Myxococcota bacterium]|nr:HEAT repeat domain-containing protein [Myxococcota bacterium]
MLNYKILFFVPWAVIILLNNCSSSCRPSQLIVRSVIIELPAHMPSLSKNFDRDQLSLLVKKAINQHEHFKFDETYSKGGLLRLSLIAPSERASSLLVIAALVLSDHGETKEYKSNASIKINEGIISGADVSTAINRVLENLYYVYSGRAVNYEEYVEAIEAAKNGRPSPQADLLNAIAVIGDAKELKAVKPLSELMTKTDDLAIGNACLIALTEIGREEAMPAIIDYVERKPSIFRRQAIIAARRIGSKLSAEWLLVMAYGHDDPVVRKEAFDALQVVEEKL